MTTESDINQGLQMALLLHQQNRVDEAIGLYNVILSFRPEHADALHLLGVAQHQIGNSPEGVELIRRAISRSPKQPEFHNNLGQALEAMGDAEGAQSAYRQALRLDKNMTDALSNLGAILLTLGKQKEAIRALRKAVGLDPNHAMATMNLGNAIRTESLPREAIDLHRRASNLAPLSEKVWVNLATSCMDLQHLEEASLALKRSLVLSPKLIESWNNFGFLHINYSDYKTAERCFRVAISVEADYGSPYAGLAEVEFLQDRVEQALSNSERALDLFKGDPQVRNRRAIQLLASGRIAEGWTMREARLENRNAIEHRGRPPVWDGSSLAGQSIVITAEEGIGDEILFASCLPDVIAKANQCYIECDARLVTLFQRSFPKATVEHVRRSGDRFKPIQTYDWLPTQPPVNCAVEAGSLFKHFRQNLDAYEGVGTYLIPDEARVAKWRDRLGSLGPGLKVGFSWRSKELSQFRNIHYTTLEEWTGLLRRSGIHWISMQYGDGWEKEVETAKRTHGVKIVVFDDADLSDDFETIFALGSALDLIICPSSTVSWVGGAIGKPTWVMHVRPNFMRLGTDYFPGFPSMRSFPKNVADPWSTCFQPISLALDKLLE